MGRLPTTTVAALVVAALALGALGMGLVVEPVPPTSDAATGDTEPTVADGPASNTAGAAEEFEALYDDRIDSVVTVHTSRNGSRATGSAFVYDDRGHLLTNHHVVSNATRVEVRFADGEWRTATVVGEDRRTDLAVLRIDDPPEYADPLPVAEYEPRSGQRAVAIGSPLRLDGTITVGVVSGVGRSLSLPDGTVIPGAVQTDAAINPGNSGGPLLDAEGNVIGVNTAKYEGNNVGFAVSPAIFERVAPELIEDGSYEHPHLGAETFTVDPSVAEANGFDQPRGAMVTGIERGGPADGVLQRHSSTATVNDRTVPVGGDVIVAVGETPIDTRDDLRRAIATETSPDETVELTIVRDGERLTVELTMAGQSGA